MPPLPPSTPSATDSVVSYEQAGVNVALGDRFVEQLKQRIKRPGHSSLPKAAGGYASVMPFSPDKWLALTTDGVGTKLLLAQSLNRFDTIGIDLVAMCANDLLCVGATPTGFLDYYATGQLTMEQGLGIIDGIVAGCDLAGMLLLGGETAEMPDVYSPGDFDLAGFAVGECHPNHLITGERIAPGQVVIGLPSSGVHSNGLSLARRCLGSEHAEALLTPTEIYCKPVLSLLESYRDAVTGMVHVTGGGWRNLMRLNASVGFSIDTPLPVPEIFNHIEARGVSRQEMVHTFNMGLGFALIVDATPDATSAIIQQLKTRGIDAQIIGRVTDTPSVCDIPPWQLQLVPA